MTSDVVLLLSHDVTLRVQKPEIAVALLATAYPVISVTPPDQSTHLPDRSSGVTNSSVDPLRPPTPLGTHPPQETLEDTPARARATDHHSYRNGSLDQKRRAVIQDLGQAIPEVELDFFFNSILPPLPDINLDGIHAALKRGRYIPRDRWKWFPKDPCESKSHETTTFAPLAHIFGLVTKLAIEQNPDLQQTLILRLDPDTAPDSERMSTTKPDGYMILKEAEEYVNSDPDALRWWYDLAGTAEVKKHELARDRDDNVSKQVFSMQRTMSLDPCRRFTFGITAENSNMRLWFCSRAVVVVSKRFNFIRDYMKLTRVFLSFAFASKTELGWDPTIAVRTVNERRIYIIDVNGTKYETVEVLSDFGADALIGRATRVFKVRVEGTDKEHVLKDVWVDDDRDLEHVIYDHVLTAIGETFGDEIKERAKSYFLTPINHCLVTVDGQEDHTTKVAMRSQEPSFDHTFDLVIREVKIYDVQKSTAAPVASDIEVLDDRIAHVATRAPPVDARKRMHRRKHYRIVFEEVAEPLWTVRRLSDVFVVIRDGCQILTWMHESDWVHRDISAGNVYLFKGRGLLGDLEYAKMMGLGGSHEVRTGTLDYMAVEVANCNYMFTSGSKASKTTDLDIFLSQQVNEQDNLPTPNFTYNDIHDMESMWWLPIWMLFFHRDASITNDEARKTQEEKDESARKAGRGNGFELRTREFWTEALFPRTLDIGYRLSFLNGTDFKNATDRLSSTFSRVIKHLNLMRGTLMWSYYHYEEYFDKMNIREVMHKKFIEVAQTCIQNSGSIELKSYKTTSKRMDKEAAVGTGNDTAPAASTSSAPALSIGPSTKRKAPTPLPRKHGYKLRKRSRGV